jgi:hypothetical protein
MGYLPRPRGPFVVGVIGTLVQLGCSGNDEAGQTELVGANCRDDSL